MLAATKPINASRPIYTLGLLGFFVLGFYLGLLFGVGAFAALMVGFTLFKGKFRLLVSLGGGFTGLAAWITVLLNHRDEYEQVIAFFARFLAQNWATFVVDAGICTLGSLAFVTLIAGTRKTTKQAIHLVARRGSKSSLQEVLDEAEEHSEE